jgi:hypothetical protein
MKFKNLKNNTFVNAVGDLAQDLLKDKNYRLAVDADFKESEHPRDKDGKFGSGGGGSSAAIPKASKPEKTASKSEKPKKSSKYPNEIEISDHVMVDKFRDEWVITVFTSDGKKGQTFGAKNKEDALKKGKAWSKLSDPEILELMKPEWEK